MTTLSARFARTVLLCIFIVAIPALAGAQTLKIAAIGDYGSNVQFELDVSNLVKSWNPDYIITLGDNNYPTGDASTIDANIGKYYHSYIYNYNGAYGAGSATRRFLPSPGNHDWGDILAARQGLDPYTNYFDLPGNERYYNLNVGSVEFFAVDSGAQEPDGLTPGSIQGTWLQGAMAASTATWKLVYFHHPAYSSGKHGSTATMQWPYAGWGASAVLSGHDHVYERLNVNGTPYFVNGLGGGEKEAFKTPIAQSLVRYNGDYGAMLITADPSSCKFQFFTRTGVLIDTFTLSNGDNNNPPPPPTNLTTSLPAGTKVNLAWTASTGAASYSVMRGTTSGGPYGTVATNVTTTNYADTGLTNGTTYYYVVTATNAAGTSGNSNEASATPQPFVSSLTLNPTSVPGGTNSVGTVNLDSAAPSNGAAVALSSSNVAATVPAAVTVPSGATSANFTITTAGVTSNTTSTITGTYLGSSQSATLTITAPQQPVLTSLTLAPTSVVGGNSSTGTVTLDLAAPSGGAVVSLSSSNAAATVPASVTIPSGSTSANFTITTSAVASNTTSTITATYMGVSKTATLTITAQAQTGGTLKPVADAYVRAGPYKSDTNFGTAVNLIVQKATADSSSTSNYCSYLKFDLTGVTTAPASAVLKLTVTSSSTPYGSVMTLNLYDLGNPAWTETGITWNNAPGLDRTTFQSLGTQLATQQVTLKSGTISFDLTAYVASHLGQVVTLQLLDPALENKTLYLNSKEAASGGPTLTLQ